MFRKRYSKILGRNEGSSRNLMMLVLSEASDLEFLIFSGR